MAIVGLLLAVDHIPSSGGKVPLAVCGVELVSKVGYTFPSA